MQKGFPFIMSYARVPRATWQTMYDKAYRYGQPTAGLLASAVALAALDHQCDPEQLALVEAFPTVSIKLFVDAAPDDALLSACDEAMRLHAPAGAWVEPCTFIIAPWS